MSLQRSHFSSQVVWMAGLNAFSLFASIILGISMRLGPGALNDYFLAHFNDWMYYVGSVVLANYLVGGYGMQLKVSRFNLFIDWIFSVVVALLVVSITSYAWFEISLGRGVLAITVAVYSAIWLSTIGFLYSYVFKTDSFAFHVAIVGVCDSALDLKRVVTDELIRPRHKVVAFLAVDESAPADPARLGGTPVIRVAPENMLKTVRGLEIDALLLGDCRNDVITRLYTTLRRLRFESLTVLDYLNVMELYTGRIPLTMVDENWLMQASVLHSSPVFVRVKRIIDCVISFCMLVLLAPLMACIALCIKLSAPKSHVLFTQPRMGQFGQPFVMFKFRTMREHADDAGATWSPTNDPRITWLGKILRRYRMDEIPQLFNVLRGDMSLIGPRPEQPDLIREIERLIPFYRERENILPGITGWAQVRHPYGASIEDTRRKLEYDLFYMNNLSFALDLRILLNTLRIVILGLERKEP